MKISLAKEWLLLLAAIIATTFYRAHWSEQAIVTRGVYLAHKLYIEMKDARDQVNDPSSKFWSNIFNELDVPDWNKKALYDHAPELLEEIDTALTNVGSQKTKIAIEQFGMLVDEFKGLLSQQGSEFMVAMIDFFEPGGFHSANLEDDWNTLLKKWNAKPTGSFLKYEFSDYPKPGTIAHWWSASVWAVKWNLIAYLALWAQRLTVTSLETLLASLRLSSWYSITRRYVTSSIKSLVTKFRTP
jgi:hypothetical protein